MTYNQIIRKLDNIKKRNSELEHFERDYIDEMRRFQTTETFPLFLFFLSFQPFLLDTKYLLFVPQSQTKEPITVIILHPLLLI